MNFSRRSYSATRRLVQVVLFSPVLASWLVAEPSGALSFNRDIRPILAENCLQCHGPDKGTREAGLRLDVQEDAFAGVEGRPAIVPGTPEDSEMFRRITARGTDDVMPPESTGKVLTDAEVATIEQWIREGAEYEPHWSYLAPERKDPPPVAGTEWVRNPIDAFVLARLEEQEIHPQPEANRHTLLRRLSFDLRGLPPTTAELEEFLADDAPDAYERWVERFLASPHYGERMAVYWLDLVRFADTVGYHGDQPTHVYPYRDYVIRAFNENMPFDQFTREQLAGDLLPEPTTDQLVATAYNRLNMVTREGGAQAKEYLAKYASDRVRTTSSVWMASTVGCAECHDHKFDPFTAKDFYAFAAFFADVEEQGVYQSNDFDGTFPPVLRLPDEEQKERLSEFERELAEVQREAEPANAVLNEIRAKETPLPEATQAIAAHLQSEAEGIEEAHADWLARMELVAAGEAEMEIPIVSGASGGAAGALENWNVVSHSGQSAREQSARGVVRHAAADFTPPEPLRRPDKLFAWIYLDADDPPAGLMLQVTTSAGAHHAWWGAEEIVANLSEPEESKAKRAGDIPNAGAWVRLEVPAAEIGINAKTPVQAIAFVQQGGRAWWGRAGFLGKQRGIPRPLVAALKKEPEERTEQEQRDLLSYYFASTELWAASKKEASIEHQKREFEKTLPTTVVTRSVEPRVVRVLPRGNWMDESGEIVEPAVPHFLPQPAAEEERRLNRLDLAEWFVSPENPLTARTMVNRFWKLFYGVGISRSLDELGNRGEWPVNQDLLDWLAVEFIESGWDVKHMVRMLVTSSAYRVSSRAPGPLREIDPNNRLHARQARPRLDAEFVRDNALAVSGLLVRDIGGPSAKPYQPDGYYRELNFPKREYVADTGDQQYRRGVYTHWQRTFLHPSLMAFDAPSREECTAERPYSNTPLQALVLLNNPTYVEAARAFAARVLTECGGSEDGERVAWAWREALSRSPRESESAALLELLQSARQEYEQDSAAAEQLATVGQFAAPENLSLTELAAWTAVTRTILNLQEAFVRY